MRTSRASISLLCAACVAVAAWAADTSNRIHPAITAAVESADRPAADRQRDTGRKPAEVLEFFGVRPGQTLIEFVATGGNTAEILSRVVGPKGKVYYQNVPQFYERGDATKRIEERLANNRLPNVVRLDKPLNDLGLPPASLDGAVMNLVFHDMFWMSQDVPDVLKDLHAALKPGGFVGVADHSAPAGSGADFARDREKGTHRIDEEYTKRLFKEAGFVLEAQSDLARNPEDDRSKPFFAPEFREGGKFTDRFVLRFRKPAR